MSDRRTETRLDNEGRQSSVEHSPNIFICLSDRYGESTFLQVAQDEL